MRNKKQILFTFILFMLCNCFANTISAQNKAIDSLLNVLKTEKDDTNKVNTELHLCYAYMDLDSFAKSNEYANKEIVLSEKINYKIGKANALYDLGGNSFSMGKNEEAIKYFMLSMEIYNELGNKKNTASCYSTIGLIYYVQGKYPYALKNYISAVKLNEEINNKSGMASSYNMIGVIYQYEGDYTNALKYGFESLKIRESLNDKHNMALSYTNIGIVYSKIKDYDNALKNYALALKTYIEQKDKKNIAGTYVNIGNVYRDNKGYTDALKNYSEGKKILEEIKDKKTLITVLESIGVVQEKEGKLDDATSSFLLALKLSDEINDNAGMFSGNQYFAKISMDKGEKAKSNKDKQEYYTKADEYLKKSLEYAKELNSLSGKKESYEFLVELDSVKGNYKQSLEHYKMYISYRDSIENKENTKKIVEQQMNYDFEQKEEGAKAEQDKKDALANKEKEKQKVVTYSVSAGLLLVLVLALFILRGYRQKQKDNLIITKQKELVEQQKAIVELQNHDITDSIKYAKNIQEALLPPLQNVLNEMNDAFVLYLPKDIVSGDFYWFSKQSNKRFIASVDCTGHGVPGAFMSIIGNSVLNEIVNVENITQPAEILNRLHAGVKTALKQSNSDNERRDGMDIALCSLNENNTILEYAGANRPLWIFRKNKTGDAAFEMIKANKFPIGGLEMENEVKRQFTNHTINVEKGDVVYIFSDGFADQFGGAKGKKFMLGNLQKLVANIYDKPIKEQKQLLHKAFSDWRGEQEQVDDVLVIGFRV